MALARRVLGPPSLRALAVGRRRLRAGRAQREPRGPRPRRRGTGASSRSGCCVLTGTIGYVTARRMRRDRGDAAVDRAGARDRAPACSATCCRRARRRCPASSVVARFQPMTAVGGDFYDYAADAGGLAVLVADVTGHGVPAALTAAMVKVAFAAERDGGVASRGRARARQPHAHGRERVRLRDGRLGCTSTRRPAVMTYAAAGHPPLLVWRAATGAVERVTENGLLMGAFAEAEYTEVELPARIRRSPAALHGRRDGSGERGGRGVRSRPAGGRAGGDGAARAARPGRRDPRRASPPGAGAVAQGDDVTLVLLART